MKFPLSVTGFAVATAILGPFAQLHSLAAPITWGSPLVINDDSDVRTTGSLVFAYNFNGPDTTVNGVLFQQTPRANNYVAGSPSPLSPSFHRNIRFCSTPLFP